MADLACPDCSTPLQRMECGGVLAPPGDGDVGVCGTCFAVLEFYKDQPLDPYEGIKARTISSEDVDRMSPMDRAMLRATRDRAALLTSLVVAGMVRRP